MRFTNKKGISPVIATILLILITVAAVTIIWAAIIPMIKDKTATSTACYDATSRLTIDTQSGFTCINSTNHTMINVQRSAGGSSTFTYAGLQLTFIKSDGSSVSVEKSAADVPSENGAKVYTFTSVQTGNSTKVSIAPILAIGNTKKLCDAVVTVSIPACNA